MRLLKCGYGDKMNNRYKELAAEATGWCERNAVGTPVAWEWEEKFAELIVRECVHMIDDMASLPDDIGGNRYLEFASERLKQHFGIK